jgi:phage-related protein
MSDRTAPKPLEWVGDSRETLQEFPDEVRKSMGYALYLAQTGEKSPDAKPMRGFGGASVLEVVEDHDGDTYRAMYTVKFRGVVFVLHAFQKKSKRGVETPKHELDLLKQRLKAAKAYYDEHYEGKSR